MKKILSMMSIGIVLLMLISCKPAETNGKMYTIRFFNEYMHTYIEINFFAKNIATAEIYRDDIAHIYSMYHELTTNYESLGEDSFFKENIFSINQKPGEPLEIDKELYEILLEAQLIYELTDGYFNISIGHIIDLWKELINEEYAFAEIPETVMTQTLETLESFTIEEDPYTLIEQDGKYFISLKNENVKLDLGAISKGYATQKVYEYLEEKEQYFSISAGSSSIALGQNINRPDEEYIFRVSLTNPVRTGETLPNYGRVFIKDTTITTSGNYEQYALYGGDRYHHIISPITKRPMQYYHTVTIIGENAGYMDAISTALFSMDTSAFEQWLSSHQEALNIEIVRFNYDGTISTFLTQTRFEEVS